MEARTMGLELRVHCFGLVEGKGLELRGLGLQASRFMA